MNIGTYFYITADTESHLLAIYNHSPYYTVEITLSRTLPPYPAFIEDIRRTPSHSYTLNPAQTATVLKNALRYTPKELHETLTPEFMEELRTRGHIHGYRHRSQGDLKAKPTDEYKGRCIEGKVFQVMIDNNLCFDIALYPYELVAYGKTGQVCQNWMQYRLIKQYLEVLTCDQTFVIESGHPLGLFKSKPEAPRVIIMNAIMVGLHDNQQDQHIAMQMGVANHGQMTAGGWMHIGPQSVMHDTFNTLPNAGRLRLGIPQDGDLRGRFFVSFGLGGMNGAQPKAAEMSGVAAIVAEVSASCIDTRHRQGRVGHVTDSLPQAFSLVGEAMDNRIPISIVYHGNVVDLLEYAAKEQVHIDLLSDRAFRHTAYDGGYCPAGLTFGERTRMLHEDLVELRCKMDATLKRHLLATKELVGRDTYFFDYDNSFMKVVYGAGVIEIACNGNDKNGFTSPSYVEGIASFELFDYGYGPFRWVRLSGRHEDLVKTDRAAMECIDPTHHGQDLDNYSWIRNARKSSLVVGTQAHILYQDAERRTKIVLRFNEMVRRGEVGPIMLGRDHHDVSGTDSPFRETSNIKDGSNVMADMAVQYFAGNCARGMSPAMLYNGGGVDISKAINGGFGMVCDDSKRVGEILCSVMFWDVTGGVARRSWARNEHVMEASEEFNHTHLDGYHIAIPYVTNEELIDRYIKQQ